MASRAKIRDLTPRELANFGWTMATVVLVVFGLLIPWLREMAIPFWPAGVALALVIWSTAAPASLDPLYRVWMRFGLLLSRFTTPLILTLVFLLTIVPTALVMRALRRDPLHRRLDGNAESYRVESDQTTEKSLDNPF
ncbi:MAG: SxtJ family membrane protein [Pseudomonadota bacterium]